MVKKKLDDDGLLPADPQLRLFAFDIEAWPAKGDRHSMEHAFFSLTKNRDTRDRRYEHNGSIIEIRPNSAGMPTIWDKDVILYIVAHVREKMNDGVKITTESRVVIDTFNILLSTSRGDGTAQYAKISQAIDRLAGTTYKTSIPTGGKIEDAWWHWLEDVKVVRSSRDHISQFSARLPEWLMRAITSGTELLRYNRDYFRLPGGIERRMYEIARKHCGNQAKFQMRLELFARKIGAAAGDPAATSASKRDFRRKIRNLLEIQVAPKIWRRRLPDYTIEYDEERDMLIFYRQTKETTEGN